MAAPNVRAVMGIVILVIIGLAMIPIVASACDDAIRGNLKSYPAATTNSSFIDNEDGWASEVSGDRTATWENVSGNGVLTTHGENGTCDWYQSLSVDDLNEGIVSTTAIQAKYQLTENVGLGSLQIKVILDNGTDNIVIYFADNTVVASDNSTWYSIDNDVKSFITVATTYTLRLWDNAIGSGEETENIRLRWDDASLTITTSGYEPMTGASKVMLQLVPLFYVIGIVLAVVHWVVEKAKKAR